MNEYQCVFFTRSVLCCIYVLNDGRHDVSVSRVDEVRMELSESHVIDDEENANYQSPANDGVTDYENESNDDHSNNSEDVIVSDTPSDHQLTDVLSGLLAVNNRDVALIGDSSSESVPVRQHVDNSASRITELTLTDHVTKGPVDGYHQAEAVALHLPCHGCVSPVEDFDDYRDPKYATQRPDTLGAINVAAAAGVAGSFAGPVFQAAAAVRSWPMESAAENTSFTDDGTVHLGRRTCGAGMDQLEMNQRQLMNSDDNIGSDDDADGSELCDDNDDARLGSGNQCESTEADQYKMDPEADQSAGAVDVLAHSADSYMQDIDRVGLICDDVRSAACGCTLGRRHQTDGALSDISHDMDDPEEDQADRATSVHNAKLEIALLKPEGDEPLPCDEHKCGALKQHPQSAFSVPKPRVNKSKSAESDMATYPNMPVPSVCQSKSNTDIIFKPISASVGKSNSAPRTLITYKSSHGKMHGEITHRAADTTHSSTREVGLSHTDGHAVVSGKSRWNKEPYWKVMDQRAVVSNNDHASGSISLPSACHLSGEGGAIAVGILAPTNNSSQQATPQKTEARACHILDKSLDISPIQRTVSSSSRPLSVNGLHATDLASVNDIFPRSESYLSTQGSPPDCSHKVCHNIYYFMISVAGEFLTLLHLS